MENRCPAQTVVDDIPHACTKPYNHDGAASIEIGTVSHHVCSCGMAFTQTVVSDEIGERTKLQWQ